MLAEPNEVGGFGMDERLERNRAEVEARLAKVGADLATIQTESGGYAFRATIRYGGDLKPLADYLEDIDGCEVLSLGNSLEIVKDLGDAESVHEQYQLGDLKGTHGIGHVRMATESDVDLARLTPTGRTVRDVSVVHNGQLTNYHEWRRRLERMGHRFQSECDSEIIAVYLAQQLENGLPLETAMKHSLDDFDGVFTYLVATGNELGVAKDEMAAKPLVLMETDDLVVWPPRRWRSGH
ncbi:MAG: hypothetical protein Ct9H300mP12_13510 [Acidimicrobiales bacterium]|nr:MAG: hypothetical protein Ct9H300mP12_13510 [Acidimicrobiales bacterium]